MESALDDDAVMQGHVLAELQRAIADLNVLQKQVINAEALYSSLCGF